MSLERGDWCELTRLWGVNWVKMCVKKGTFLKKSRFFRISQRAIYRFLFVCFQLLNQF